MLALSALPSLSMSLIRGVEMITCKICDEKFKSITPSHLKNHNMTSREYWLAFPKAPMISDKTKQKASVSVKRYYQEHPEAGEQLSKKAKKRYRDNPGAYSGFRGHKHSPETIEKIRQRNLGRKDSEETRLKRIESQKRFWREHPESKDKLSKKIKKRHRDNPRKKKRSE